MEIQKKLYSQSLVNFLLIAFRIIFLLGSLSIIIISILLFVDLASGGTSTFAIDLPTRFSLSGEGDFLISNDSENLKFEIPYAEGIIHSETLPKSIVIISIVSSILLTLCVLFVVKIICQILESAKSSFFLVQENALRLRRIALLGLLIFVIKKIFTLVPVIYLSDKLAFSGVDFHGINFWSFSNFDYLFGSLFLLVIAEAFRIGAHLKQENDLTI